MRNGSSTFFIGKGLRIFAAFLLLEYRRNPCSLLCSTMSITIVNIPKHQKNITTELGAAGLPKQRVLSPPSCQRVKRRSKGINVTLKVYLQNNLEVNP